MVFVAFLLLPLRFGITALYVKHFGYMAKKIWHGDTETSIKTECERPLGIKIDKFAHKIYQPKPFRAINLLLAYIFMAELKSLDDFILPFH